MTHDRVSITDGDLCLVIGDESILRFDFCAECLASFVSDNLGRTAADAPLPLGFTVGLVPFGMPSR